MPKQAMENLTESMFYLLMALQQGDACGAEISRPGGTDLGRRRAARPRHLYTLLARFEKEGLLTDAGTVGCKRYLPPDRRRQGRLRRRARPPAALPGRCRPGRNHRPRPSDERRGPG